MWLIDLMKAMFTIIGLLIASPAMAQTNQPIIFNQVLSVTNTLLMTNAEFRCFSGDKAYFRSADGSDHYKVFSTLDLNSNVLAVLGTSPEKIKAQQLVSDLAQQKRQKEIADYQSALKAKRELAVKQFQKEAAERMVDDERKYQESIQIGTAIRNHATERESIGAAP